jgi:thiosulfate reductase cytochrome b subunit
MAKKHALSTRLWHWVNAIAIIVLFMTGLNISNAHRHLYWGHYGFDPKDAWLSVIRFPGWATIPGHYNLALARDWHITMAWPFGVGVLFIWVAMLINGHFRRDLMTSPKDWTPAAVIASIKAHSGPGGHADGYNSVQKILYGGVFGVLLPLMLFTGLAISPGFQAAAPWLLDVFGGRQSARSLHFLAAWAIFGFFVIHIVLAVSDWRLILEMFTGGTREAEAAPAPAPPQPEPDPATEEGAPAHG